MMHFKRFVSFLLAMILSLSMAVPAFADLSFETVGDKVKIIYKNGTSEKTDTKDIEGRKTEITLFTASQSKFSKKDYELVGWKIDGEEYDLGEKFIFRKDDYSTNGEYYEITAEAIWEEESYFLGKVIGTYKPGATADGTTFKENYTEEYEGQTGYYVVTFPNADNFDSQGRAFKGWIIEGDDSNTVYEPGDKIALNENFTATARWENKVITGGDDIPESSSGNIQIIVLEEETEDEDKDKIVYKNLSTFIEDESEKVYLVPSSYCEYYLGIGLDSLHDITVSATGNSIAEIVEFDPETMELDDNQFSYFVVDSADDENLNDGIIENGITGYMTWENVNRYIDDNGIVLGDFGAGSSYGLTKFYVHKLNEFVGYNRFYVWAFENVDDSYCKKVEDNLLKISVMGNYSTSYKESDIKVEAIGNGSEQICIELKIISDVVLFEYEEIEWCVDEEEDLILYGWGYSDYRDEKYGYDYESFGYVPNATVVSSAAFKAVKNEELVIDIPWIREDNYANLTIKNISENQEAVNFAFKDLTFYDEYGEKLEGDFHSIRGDVEHFEFGFLGNQTIDSDFEMVFDFGMDLYELRELFGKRLEELDIVDFELYKDGIKIKDIVVDYANDDIDEDLILHLKGKAGDKLGMYTIGVKNGEVVLCKHENTTLYNYVSSKCYRLGYTGDLYCDDCCLLLEKGRTIGQGHNFKDGVCQDCGYSEGVIDHGECGTNLEWTLTENGALTISGTGKMWNYDRSYIDGKGYVSTAPWDEYIRNGSIYGILLNEGITTIGKYAFYEIDNDISINNGSGYITFPDSLRSIGAYAFYGCDGLKGNISFGNKLEDIGEDAFSYCKNLNGSLVIPDSVKTIGDYAFDNCNGFDSKLIIGSSVETIGSYAFSDCYFYGNIEVSDKKINRSLEIPDSVKTIGSHAFYNCKGFNYLKLGKGLTSIGSGCFSGCSGFRGTLVIPENVTGINRDAFRGCSGITGLTLPGGINYIDSGAFYGCSSLSGDLIIPSGTRIDENAFSGCGLLENVYFLGSAPDILNSWNENASFEDNVTFYYIKGMSGWTEPEYRGYTTVLWDIAEGTEGVAYGFCGAENKGMNLKWVLSEDGTLTISGEGAMRDYMSYSNMAPWNEYKNSISKLVIEDGVTSIGDYAFYDCSGFTGELVIPDSVTSIGDSAFYYCYGFTGNLVIPNSVASIGNDAFEHCSKFTGDLVIPNSVTDIGYGAFYSCSGLNGSLVIPDSVTSIEDYTFYGCSGFTGKLVIPNSITSIGDSAFYGCRYFTGDLIIPDSVTNIGYYAFERTSFRGVIINSHSNMYIGGCSFTDYQAIYFTGDAPQVISNNQPLQTNGGILKGGGYLSEPSFNPDVILYYLEGKSGWTTPTYMGYNTESYSLNATGYCGKNGGTNLAWSVDESGVLKISGTGKMEDYDDVKDVPWKKYIFDIVIIEEGVTSIGRNAFNGFKNIKGSLSIPDSVISISSYAFYDCTGFDGTLDLGNGVKSIGARAFANCSGFTGDLVIPDSTIEIAELAFYDCTGFNGTLTLGNGLKTIGYSAFNNCNGFTGNLIIPDNVEEIEYSAFYDCKGFTGNLVIGNGLRTISWNVFKNCSGFSGNLIIGDNVTYIDSEAFHDCSGFTGELNIPDNVEAIYSEAFYNCSGFESLKLPAKLSSIGSSAFRGCKNLSGDIVIAANATVRNNAFTGCTKLENIYFMGNAPKILDSWSEYASFEDNVTFYYVERMEGWSSPEYHGYKTATWTPDYTVTFNANGGEGAPESQIKIANTDLAISNIVPVRSGYNFKWWRGSDGLTYNPGDLYITNSNLVLTAVWVRDETIDAPRIIVSNTKGMAGSIVNVDVKLKNNPGISGIGAELIFDSSMLEFVGAQIGSGMAAMSGARSYTDLNKNGTVTFNWNNENLMDFKGDYVFATVSFKIKDSAKIGDISTLTVQYKDNNIYNSDEQNVDFLTENGTVGVAAYTPGDIDGDGDVSNKDVTRLFKRVSKMNVDVVDAALDVNGDGSINNRDVITLFYYVSLADVEIF